MLLPPWNVNLPGRDSVTTFVFSLLIYFSNFSFLLFFFLSLCIIKLITQSGILHFYFLISGEILWPETRLSQVQGKAWDWLWPRWRKSAKSQNLKWNPRGSMITMYHGWSYSGKQMQLCVYVIVWLCITMCAHMRVCACSPVYVFNEFTCKNLVFMDSLQWYVILIHDGQIKIKRTI